MSFGSIIMQDWDYVNMAGRNDKEYFSQTSQEPLKIQNIYNAINQVILDELVLFTGTATVKY